MIIIYYLSFALCIHTALLFLSFCVYTLVGFVFFFSFGYAFLFCFRWVILYSRQSPRSNSFVSSMEIASSFHFLDSIGFGVPDLLAHSADRLRYGSTPLQMFIAFFRLLFLLLLCLRVTSSKNINPGPRLSLDMICVVKKKFAGD